MAGPVGLLLYAIVKISVFKGMIKEKDSWRAIWIWLLPV
jgi:hypothetical protein